MLEDMSEETITELIRDAVSIQGDNTILNGALKYVNLEELKQHEPVTVEELESLCCCGF